MGLPGGPLPFFETKVACDELAAFVTAEAFAKRLPFELYFRDARAGMLMGIAHDVAVQNIGRLLFPKPKEDRG